MEKRILITGVNGFIGSHTARLFRREGWEVTGIDAALPGPSVKEVLSAFHGLQLPSDGLAEVVASARPSVCVHCAGPASVGLSMEEPGKDFNASVPVTFQLLDSLRLHAPECLFIYPSSAAVYGNPSRLPIDEGQQCEPISPYGYHKLMCEQLAFEFQRVYGLPAVIFRIFSAYGEGLRRQVLWDICRRALTEGSLVLKGTGKESRDFIHVEDVARAFLLAAQKGPAAGGIYNLAGGAETTIDELRRLLLKELGLSIPVSFDGIAPKGDPLNWKAGLARIRALGFGPGIGIEEGAARFARWCRDEING